MPEDNRCEYLIQLPELGWVRANEVTAPENTHNREFQVAGLLTVPQGNHWRGSLVPVHRGGEAVEMRIDNNAYIRKADGTVDYTEYHVWLSHP